MTDSKSIVERVRDQAGALSVSSHFGTEMFFEAADHIESQDKQIADQDGLIKEQFDDNVENVTALDKANKQIAELEKINKAKQFHLDGDDKEIDYLHGEVDKLQAVVDDCANALYCAINYGMTDSVRKSHTNAKLHATPEGK
ncbi:MAG: hypothetical protein O7D95_03060 [Betaproteobacteria bacterium]|nr:hypothetical protein [Betaproteobacteria bacterium]